MNRFDRQRHFTNSSCSIDSLNKYKTVMTNCSRSAKMNMGLICVSIPLAGMKTIRILTSYLNYIVSLKNISSSRHPELSIWFYPPITEFGVLALISSSQLCALKNYATLAGMSNNYLVSNTGALWARNEQTSSFTYVQFHSNKRPCPLTTSKIQCCIASDCNLFLTIHLIYFC